MPVYEGKNFKRGRTWHNFEIFDELSKTLSPPSKLTPPKKESSKKRVTIKKQSRNNRVTDLSKKPSAIITKEKELPKSNLSNNCETIPKQIRNKSVTKQSQTSSTKISKKEPVLSRDSRNNPVTFAKQLSNNSETNIQVSPSKYLGKTISKNLNKSVTNAKQLRNNLMLNANTPLSDISLRNNSVSQPVTVVKQLRNNSETNISIHSLHGHEKNILLYIFNLCQSSGARITPQITFSTILVATDIPSTQTVRVSIYRLIKKGFLIKNNWKSGRGGWIKLEIPEYLYKDLSYHDQSNYVTNTKQLRNNSVSQPVTEHVTTPPSSSYIINKEEEKTTTNNRGGELPEEWQEINIAPIEDIGFTHHHLTQMFIKGNHSAQDIQNSIDAFAFDLKENDKGKSFKTGPLNGFMGILLKQGVPYSPPKNYESPQLRAKREYVEFLKAEREKEREINTELEALIFPRWFSGLKDEDKEAILKETYGDGLVAVPEPQKNKSLKRYFQEYILPKELKGVSQ